MKKFVFILHYAILVLFLAVLITIAALFGIKSKEVFVLFCSLFGMTSPILYLVLGIFKEYKYMNYHMPKFMIIANVTTVILATLELYVYFKLPNNYFETLWYAYEIVLVGIIFLPIIIAYIINKIIKKKKSLKK